MPSMRFSWPLRARIPFMMSSATTWRSSRTGATTSTLRSRTPELISARRVSIAIDACVPVLPRKSVSSIAIFDRTA